MAAGPGSDRTASTIFGVLAVLALLGGIVVGATTEHGARIFVAYLLAGLTLIGLSVVARDVADIRDDLRRIVTPEEPPAGTQAHAKWEAVWAERDRRDDREPER